MKTKLIKSIYEDEKGNQWILERHTEPRARTGEKVYWSAECSELKISWKENLKGDLIRKIERLVV